MKKCLMIITILIFAMFFLSQTGSTEVAEGKTMIIEGVERLQWGKGMESTYIGALMVAMNAIGEDVTYDYLMGVSGAAFRLHIYHPGWCPSAPDASVGFNHGIPAMKAMGYKVMGIESDGNKPEDVEKVRKAVMESIDRGYPVIAIDLKEVPDWGVIVGYADGGKEFISRTYYDKTEEYSKAEKWPWVVDIIKEKTDKPDTKESILKSLEIAIEIANTEKYGNYFSGFAAYEVWINDLLNDSMFESADKEKLGSMIHANAWSYSSLGDARSAAIKYLRSIKSHFGEKSASHITKTAEIYEKILTKLKDGFKYAPYPWQLKDDEQWTAEMRHAEAGVLREVLVLEKEAIKELELAKTGMKEDKKLVINVDRYRVMDPIFEGVRVIMSYRGEKYSPEYIQGISGAAFRISGICPCATTCSWMMNPYDLPKLLGYETDCVFLNQEGIDKKAVLSDIIAQVKGEIRAGRPVLVWNAFTTAEWDVVCGFDDEKKQFIGRGSYEGLDGYAIADENRTAEWVPSWPNAIFIKDKVAEFNAQEAEIASLKEAVKHAHTIKEIPADGKWVRLEGLQCYDRWVNDFQNPSKKRELGDLICIIAYSSTHRAAGGFMKELMPKYPEVKENLEKASEYFVAEANVLDQCNSLIGHNTPEGPDADRNAKTAKLLKQARDNYANAINEVEEALKKIGEERR